MKVGQLASKCGQLVQWVIKSATINAAVATVTVIQLGKVLVVIAVQMVMYSVGEVSQIIWLWHHHGGRAEVEEQSPAEAQ